MQLHEDMPGFDDPVALLRACHVRIQRHLDVLDRAGAMLAEHRGNIGQHADAIESALRYFRVAAPLHVADEEESLFPRLVRAAKQPAQLHDRVLAALNADHKTLHARHDALDTIAHSLLERLQEDAAPGRFEPHLKLYRELVAQIRQVYAGHIHTEETEILPAAAQLLAPHDFSVIGQEMAARRGLAACESPGAFASRMGLQA